MRMGRNSRELILDCNEPAKKGEGEESSLEIVLEILLNPLSLFQYPRKSFPALSYSPIRASICIIIFNCLTAAMFIKRKRRWVGERSKSLRSSDY